MEPAEETIPHLDNTKRHSFVECRRKYYFQYVMNYKTFYGSNALRYGLVWHEGMDKYYSHIKENGFTRDGKALEVAFEAMKAEWDSCSAKENFYSDYRTLENCFASFLQYVQYFAQDELMLKVINTEEPFKIHMEPENEEERKLFRELKPFHFTGKIDMEIELNGRQWINEHKTTGQPLDAQVARLNRSAQVMGYFYAKKRMQRSGENPDGVLMTVHHLSCRKSTAKGNEGNYGAPKIDFRRVPQVFSDNDIKQWRLSFMSTALDIQREVERNLWPMNHDSCFNYGSCPFLAICEQSTDVNNIRLDEQRYYIAEPWEVAKSVTADGVIN
jgi:hypothetical protein